MVLDSIVVVVVISVALLAASTVRIDNFSRAIGIIVPIAWLLYEPALVSLAGGTLGHYFVNLRVVDNRHGGNVSFLKAVVRFVIKTILGLFSFIVMTATRRNQALNLLLLQTVQEAAAAVPPRLLPFPVVAPDGLRRTA